MILLLSGDAEKYPGPLKFPCTTCKKSIRCNQKGICCDQCDMRLHSRCCSMSANKSGCSSSSDMNSSVPLACGGTPFC